MSITETFPSWFLGRNPDKRVIEVSYSDSLARNFGDKCRRKVEEFGPEIFGVDLDHRRADKSDWGIAGYAGGMIAAGIGGSITGKGADLLIIDDPIKNRLEADSQTYRERVWSEWQSTLETRLHPGGRVVVVLTRWHEDDLAGRLVNAEPDRWKVVNLPAIAEEGDPLGRPPGEALWPERYNEKALAKKKKAVGSRDWEALYQGHPSPQEGAILQRGWWKYYSLSPGEMVRNMEVVILSFDCAFKDTSTSDFVVGQVLGRKGPDFYLLDLVRGRMDFPATVQAVRSLAAKWRQARAKLIEDKANGPAVIATLKKQISGLIPVNPEGGKIARANAVAPYIEAGNVWLPIPEHAPWVHDFVEECACFPNGPNDDQVDGMSQGLSYLAQHTSAPPIAGGSRIAPGIFS
jgi:predicted phage terminase large subunit-like protein